MMTEAHTQPAEPSKSPETEAAVKRIPTAKILIPLPDGMEGPELKVEMRQMNGEDITTLREIVTAPLDDPLKAQELMDLMDGIGEGPRNWYLKDSFEKSILNDGNYLFWSLYVNGEFIGFTLLLLSEIEEENGGKIKVGETGIFITNPAYNGKGIATHAHKVRTALALRHYERDLILSYVYIGNSASHRALSRTGYKVSGIQKGDKSFPEARTLKNSMYRKYILIHPDRIANIESRIASLPEEKLSPDNLQPHTPTQDPDIVHEILQEVEQNPDRYQITYHSAG